MQRGRFLPNKQNQHVSFVSESKWKSHVMCCVTEFSNVLCFCLWFVWVTVCVVLKLIFVKRFYFEKLYFKCQQIVGKKDGRWGKNDLNSVRSPKKRVMAHIGFLFQWFHIYSVLSHTNVHETTTIHCTSCFLKNV